ncbi:F0F1 ATP synthase subunit gamma [Pediococcus acidilactici]|uniref:F0F1 ATP synthase subunit gamma n=1 Tax=Pediococcus acidilactici TaxID=1254 RepID=UPI00132091F7|nr:F0F1 ATP synthase subunit gamma [Pediococcus acidilactici]KAF0333658.1 F0F1 ATP synthase subunit gamma [Pediococcus acidilactici]KAF0346634.1 F0F1 ATP synthase subunit gamma [Pediococcus acidilactici]KAF0393304.1 F0F1 ATP synthase subunit gamma [Pediococcus acidilactici]KAF0396355.1 F0F1 ATP synthase subunit gamma [Pediococcus acidilactici]KAF0409167.1 F0F1 ATP synthase subunit gamma [Pediococcus acidilactici]
MAISEQDVKRRIDSTKKTSQITTAMQMVSTAKLSQIQKHTVGYQVYAQKVESIVAHLAKSHLMNAGVAGKASSDQAISAADLLVQRPVKKTGYLVITSDRGLVGSYNSSVIKQTNDFMKEHGHDGGDDAIILAVGSTGADFYKNRPQKVGYEYRGVSDVPTFNEVREIVTTVTKMYKDGEFDELYVCYNHFVNRLSNSFHVTKLLPISGEELVNDGKHETITAEYETEPSPEVLLQEILPQYAESLVYGAILDAKTAEHAASSSAMRTASDNASDLIADLELQYNRARQSAITTEITEITGGQAALE